MMKKTCRNYLSEALEKYEKAVREYKLATDEMMENINHPWEAYEGTRMSKARNEYDDSVLTLTDAIRFALEYDR